MKRCAQCHGKLGLGVSSRNVWNGRWWVHVTGQHRSITDRQIYRLRLELTAVTNIGLGHQLESGVFDHTNERALQ
jgi:hypothetical protein